MTESLSRYQPSIETRAGSVLAVAFLIAFAAMGTMAAGVPGPLAPFSFVVVIPYFLLNGSILAYLFPSALFLLGSISLIRGKSQIPMRSLVLLCFMAIAIGGWFGSGWEYGVEYQGVSTVLCWAAFNGIISAGLSALAWSNHQSPAWGKSLLFHALLVIWPTWCGFPWLGELI